MDGFVPPVSVQKNAKKGLELREKFERGETRIGLTRAHQLSEAKEISFNIV